MMLWIVSHAEIDPCYLVGEEFRERAYRCDAENPWVGEDLERFQMFRKRQPAEMHRDSGRENGQVEAPARQQAEAAGNTQNLQYSHGPAPHIGRLTVCHLAPPSALEQWFVNLVG